MAVNLKAREIGTWVVRLAAGFGQSWQDTYFPLLWLHGGCGHHPHHLLHRLLCCTIVARLRPGEKVLNHGAAGGVGIAAIQIARHIGAEVYASAGSDEKRDFLHLLGADHVFDSRSLAFADQILAQTGGQGIDVVLNSLAGEAINRNLRILRPFGRFLELGKRDFYENTRIGLRPFRNNVSYFGIDADQLLVAQPDLRRSCSRRSWLCSIVACFTLCPSRL